MRREYIGLNLEKKQFVKITLLMTMDHIKPQTSSRSWQLKVDELSIFLRMEYDNLFSSTSLSFSESQKII